VRIEVSADAVAAERRAVVAAWARRARLRGFRPGRAPPELVERTFAREIAEELRERMVPRLYRQALEQEHLRPVAVVDLGAVTLAPGEPLAFAVSVDVEPEFALPPYQGIPLTRTAVRVTDADVDRAAASLRESNARFEAVDGRPARRDDLVQVDYRGACDGQPVAALAPDRPEIGEGRDFWVPVGEDAGFLPGLAAGLEGAAVGDHREVEVVFPAEYPVASLAGKKAVYGVDVKALRERRLPELDAEFLAGMGVKSVEALRERVRESLQAAGEQSARARLKDGIVRWLLDHVELEDLPQTVVAEEARRIIHDIVRENTRRGVSREEIEKHRDDIFDRAARSSGERVKLDYILRRIADAEQVSVSETELEQHIGRMADRYGIPRERLRAALEQREALDGIRQGLRADKTLDVVLQAAAIEESEAEKAEVNP
jgi:trigger factor